MIDIGQKRSCGDLCRHLITASVSFKLVD